MNIKESPAMQALKYKGLESARLLDLEDAARRLDTTPYDLAKKLGYETDPLRASFRYNSGALLRARLKDIEKELSDIVVQLTEETRSDLPDRMAKRALQIDMPEETRQWVMTFSKGYRDMQSLTLLQLAAPSQMQQILYGVSRAGVWNAAKAAKQMTIRDPERFIQRSGAMYSSYINEMTVPEGMLSNLAHGSLKTVGFSTTDKFSRFFNAQIADQHIQSLARAYIKNPTNKRIEGLIRELEVDPKLILEANELPQNVRARAIQNFTNMTTGVTDVRGLQLFMTSKNPYAEMFYNLRKFSATNMGEIVRQVKDAPDLFTAAQRTMTLLGGATISGTILKEFMASLLPNGEHWKVSTPMKKMMGDNAWSYAIESMVAGMFAFQVSLGLAVLEQNENILYGFLPGATVVPLLTKPEKAIPRRLPIVGPHAAAAMKERKLKGSPDFNSLGTGVGMGDEE